MFLGLLVVPLGLGMWMSFQEFSALAGYVGPAGWDNFTDLWTDRIFLGAVRNTIKFVLITTPAFVVLGLALALALNDQYRRARCCARPSSAPRSCR